MSAIEQCLACERCGLDLMDEARLCGFCILEADGRACAICGSDISHRRGDAETCTPAHKRKLSRRRASGNALSAAEERSREQREREAPKDGLLAALDLVERRIRDGGNVYALELRRRDLIRQLPSVDLDERALATVDPAAWACMHGNGILARKSKRSRAAARNSYEGAPRSGAAGAGAIGSVHEPRHGWSDRPSAHGWGPYRPSVTAADVAVTRKDAVAAPERKAA